MVIGIRGKSGAGKSLLASMLAYCLNSYGKPTLIGYLEAKPEMEKGYFRGKWRTMQFSSIVNRIASSLYDVSLDGMGMADLHRPFNAGKIHSVCIKMTKVDGGFDYLTLDSFSCRKEAERYGEKCFLKYSDDVPIEIITKSLTWENVLNTVDKVLHNELSRDIMSKSFADRFDGTLNHLIFDDVRKPEEIDLIHASEGVIVEIQRDFIVPVGSSRALSYFNENKHFYSLAITGNPVKISDKEELFAHITSEIPIGIEINPPNKFYDAWLDNDDRRDILVHNPISDPLDKKYFSSMFDLATSVHKELVEMLTRGRDYKQNK